MAVLLEIFDKISHGANIDIGVKVLHFSQFQNHFARGTFFLYTRKDDCISLNPRNISLSMFQFDHSVP